MVLAPPNPVLQLNRAEVCHCRIPQTSEQIVQHFSWADHFTLRFPHPFPRGTELTEYPMTKCVSPCFKRFSFARAN